VPEVAVFSFQKKICMKWLLPIASPLRTLLPDVTVFSDKKACLKP
jgi:hypothetical protein